MSQTAKILAERRMNELSMSHRNVVKYLTCRSVQLRDEARKARVLQGPASETFALALERAAEALDVSSQAVEGELR